MLFLSLRLRPAAVATLAAAWLTCVACSAVLNFSPDGLACDVANGQACLAGYSCNSTNPNTFVCVADHSLKAADACQLDRQCPDPLICPTGIGQCLAPCTLEQCYVPGAGCPATAYCRPVQSVAMYSDGLAHAPKLVAACVASESCTPGAQCTAEGISGGICANMGSATACVVGCEVTFAAGKYSDNCGKDVNGNLRFCQPLGPGPGQYVMACLDAGTTPQAAGSACANPVAQPCAPGLGCINHVCRSYCDLSLTPSASCSNNLHPCDLHINATQLIGYCNPSAACL
jgi:hypothetical protein